MSDEPMQTGDIPSEQPAAAATTQPAAVPVPPAVNGRRRALLLALVALLLFGSGAVTGAGMLALHMGRRMKRMADNPGQVAAAAMTRQLNLTATQRQQVVTILAKHKNDFAKVRQQMAENYRSMADEVKSVLTPEQQATFDQMLARMRKVGMMGGPGDRHGPPGDRRRGPGRPGGPHDWPRPEPPPPPGPDGPH